MSIHPLVNKEDSKDIENFYKDQDQTHTHKMTTRSQKYRKLHSPSDYYGAGIGAGIGAGCGGDFDDDSSNSEVPSKLIHSIYQSDDEGSMPPPYSGPSLSYSWPSHIPPMHRVHESQKKVGDKVGDKFEEKLDPRLIKSIIGMPSEDGMPNAYRMPNAYGMSNADAMMRAHAHGMHMHDMRANAYAQKIDPDESTETDPRFMHKTSESSIEYTFIHGINLNNDKMLKTDKTHLTPSQKTDLINGLLAKITKICSTTSGAGCSNTISKSNMEELDTRRFNYYDAIEYYKS